MTIKSRILPRFPANVLAGTGIRIDKTGIAYAFSWDVDDIAVDVAPLTTAYVLGQDANGAFYKTTIANLLAGSVGTGTVTSVSVTPANGVSGTVLNPTSTPAISLSLGSITPTSVTATGAVTGNTLVSAVATGTAPFTVASTTQVANLYASRAALADTVTTNANLTGAVTSVGNATSLGSFTSAQLAGALTDETGTGANVFAISPTIAAPVLVGQASPSYAQGKLTYDTDNECLTFYNNDSNVSLQIGQEFWIRVFNNSGSTIANRAAVKITGASSGLPTIALIQANASDVCAGLATESIANNTIGYVTSGGRVNGVDTSAFAAGATLYVDSTTPGALTATAPSAPNYRVRIGTVGVSNASTGTINVNGLTTALGFGTANQILGMNNGATGQEYKTLSVGTTGTDFAIANAANSVTFNLPDAGASARGVVTTGTQTMVGAKTFSTSVNTPLLIGGTAVGSDLVFQTTTGAGDGTDLFQWKRGNNGATVVGDLRAQGLTIGGGASSPYGWASSGFNYFQLGVNAGLFADASGSSNAATSLLNNAYNDGTNLRYMVTAPASINAMGGGVFAVLTAPSGTAGNVATFTEQFRITNTGQFQITPGGNNAMTFPVVASAVNGFTTTQSATGSNPTIAVTGTDANRDFVTVAKGTGVLINAGSNTNTHATALNLSIDTSGAIRKFSSSLRYKRDVEDMALEDRNKILELRPIWYRSRSEADNPNWSFNSFLAEEVAKIEPRWALWDYRPEDKDENNKPKNGAELVPDGLSFPAILVGLVAHVQDQEKRIKQLEKGE